MTRDDPRRAKPLTYRTPENPEGRGSFARAAEEMNLAEQHFWRELTVEAELRLNNAARHLIHIVDTTTEKKGTP
jgi:hypothetical protein